MKRAVCSMVALGFCLSMSAKAPETLNRLTKQERKAGWELIFDGETFDGWSGAQQGGIPNSWTIEDGALKIQSARNFEGRQWGDIYFTRKYKNFEFSFEWKVGEGCNSGVFYLVRFLPNTDLYFTGPEYQILDNENHGDAKCGRDGNRQSASLYDMIPAKPQNAKPYGEWNTGRIVVKDGKVEHYQNGVKVVEYTLGDDSWRERVNDSKFAGSPMLSAGEAGYIALQDHTDDAWFRNLKVRDLDR